HGGEQVPRIELDTPMRDAVYEMSRKGFGITAVVDADGRLQGVISDGDLRRLFERDEQTLGRTARECMKPDPLTIEGSVLASAALQVMETRKITSLFITDSERRLEGILHIHDLWGLELF
ncbi:MAG TPA: CBS domain-containing protein, partial [Thermoanaerobaculia bacterium]|nr:CBS domain-containing protein [Thermoanaerobaculia bacterium]